jgi:hypothetical protein
MLSIIYLREHQPEKTLEFLTELEHDFPENPLIRLEIRKVTASINRLQKEKVR